MEVQTKEHGVDVSVNSDSEYMSVGVDDQDVITTKEKKEEIAEGESKAVVWLRVLVLCVLVVSTVSVVLGVYFYMSGAEEEEFENTRRGLARRNCAGLLYELRYVWFCGAHPSSVATRQQHLHPKLAASANDFYSAGSFPYNWDGLEIPDVAAAF